MLESKKTYLNAVVSFFALFLVVSCQTTEKKESEQKILSYSEEVNLSSKLTAALEKKYGSWSNGRIEKALGNVISVLKSSDERLQKIAGTNVTLLSTDEIIFAPGFLNKIYISRGALLSIKYENELSYAIAQQLTLLKEDVVKKSYLSLQGQTFGQSMLVFPTSGSANTKDPLASAWFTKGGLFDFGEDAYLNAEKEAIKIIYKAKFDPRGVLVYLQNFIQTEDGSTKVSRIKSLKEVLPEANEQLDVARNEIAKLSPVRDPIVKTKNFEEISTMLKKAKK